MTVAVCILVYLLVGMVFDKVAEIGNEGPQTPLQFWLTLFLWPLIFIYVMVKKMGRAIERRRRRKRMK